MAASATVFLDLCRLRAGPQDLPFSPRLLGGAVLAEIGLSLASAQVMATAEAPASPLRTVLAAAFTLAALYGLLAATGRGNRFVQTALGWTVVKLVFEILALPMLGALGHPPATPEQLTPAQVLLTFPVLAAIVWLLTALTHVLRHALETRGFVAFFAVLGLLFVVPLLAAV
jgi:hypothetical protein